MTALPAYLTEACLEDLLERALAEDLGAGDVTSLATLPEAAVGSGVFLCKETGVVAGLDVARRVFARLDPSISLDWHVEDGAVVEAGTPVGAIEGPAAPLLSGERLALNLLQRMSGIATRTRAMVLAIGDRPTRLLDTRKTAPGLRGLDKWAVRLGGGRNHRVGLFDMILIKDNHIVAAGGVKPALSAARAYVADGRADLRIEIEARTLEEVDAVLEHGGADVILLDNMARRTEQGLDVSMLKEALARIGGRIETEASGNVDLDTVSAIADCGVTYISSGALTHSVRALDLSLDLRVR